MSKSHTGTTQSPTVFMYSRKDIIALYPSYTFYTRHHDWSGPRQIVAVDGEQWYSAKAYIRLLNMPAGVPYVAIEMMAVLTVNGKFFS